MPCFQWAQCSHVSLWSCAPQSWLEIPRYAGLVPAGTGLGSSEWLSAWKVFIRKERNLIKALLHHRPPLWGGVLEVQQCFNEIFETFHALIRLFMHFRARRACSGHLTQGVCSRGSGTSAGTVSPFISSWVALQGTGTVRAGTCSKWL